MYPGSYLGNTSINAGVVASAVQFQGLDVRLTGVEHAHVVKGILA